MHYIYQTLPSPRAILKAIRAGVGLGLGPRLGEAQPLSETHCAYDKNNVDKENHAFWCLKLLRFPYVVVGCFSWWSRCRCVLPSWETWFSWNSVELSTKELYLKFVDNNSQANGRHLDSRNPTHYLFPKFRTITEPKRNASGYSEKVKSSLVCEFNHTQREAGLDTILNQTALNWLKAERPKTAIYPHQTDYCDYCSKDKVKIEACQQRISRHLQSGGPSTEDIEELRIRNGYGWSSKDS